MARHVPYPSEVWAKFDMEKLKAETPDGVPPGAITSYNVAYGVSERPNRLLDSLTELKESGITALCSQIPVVRPTREQLLYSHTKEHVDTTLALCGVCEEQEKSEEELQHEIIKQMLRENFVYMNAESVDCALLAAGGVMTAVEAICRPDSEIQSAAAIVRPPGHHAECGCAMGFCLFNNVALAASYGIKDLGLERILIVDWDVHHGNGTQEIFYEDPRVLMFSVHRYDYGIFYPGSYYQAIGKDVPGMPTVVGEGPGEGYTVNLGWDCVTTGHSMGDGDYAEAWERLLMPIANEYGPQLVIIAAGFDSAKGDPEGELSLTPAGYAYLTSRLMSLAGGKVVIALEGGYNVPAVKYCLGASVGTLLGAEAPSRAELGEASPAALQAIEETINAQTPFWESLRPR